MLQVDLGKPQVLYAILTRGLPAPEPSWVTKYEIKHSMDCLNWIALTNRRASDGVCHVFILLLFYDPMLHVYMHTCVYGEETL